jgi:hypothetical protein
MTKTELFELLDKLETENWGEKGLRYEVGESFEGVQYIRFEVDDDDGDKLLSAATDDEIIAFADHEGYTLTVEDCQAIREGEKGRRDHSRSGKRFFRRIRKVKNESKNKRTKWGSARLGGNQGPWI